MENYLNCKKIETSINRAKKALINKAKANGIWENFGQEEIRKIKEKFIDMYDYSQEMNDRRKKVNLLNEWCMTYTAVNTI